VAAGGWCAAAARLEDWLPFGEIGAGRSLATTVYGEFLKGMNDFGYIEVRDFIMEWRFVAGDFSRVPGIAADLVAKQVDVSIAGFTRAALAARKATGSMPIILGYDRERTLISRVGRSEKGRSHDIKNRKRVRNPKAQFNGANRPARSRSDQRHASPEAGQVIFDMPITASIESASLPPGLRCAYLTAGLSLTERDKTRDTGAAKGVRRRC